MANLSRSDAVIELGKRLVAQLDDGDLVGAWMAHHIADLMTAVDQASAREKPSASAACRTAVFELWAHRSTFPRDRRPMQELDPILRALAALDVEGAHHRYFPRALDAAANAKLPEEAAKWFKFASGIDYTARLLIRYALLRAAATSVDEVELWLDLAREAGADEGVEGDVVGFLRDIADDETGRDRVALSEKVQRLKAFILLATSLAEGMETQLDTPEPEDD